VCQTLTRCTKFAVPQEPIRIGDNKHFFLSYSWLPLGLGVSSQNVALLVENNPLYYLHILMHFGILLPCKHHHSTELLMWYVSFAFFLRKTNTMPVRARVGRSDPGNGSFNVLTWLEVSLNSGSWVGSFILRVYGGNHSKLARISRAVLLLIQVIMDSKSHVVLTYLLG